MRMLLTGATGYIGRRLCSRFAENGWELWALSRDARRAQDSLDSVKRWFEWQPEAGPPPDAAFEGVATVINLIGERISGIWTPAKRRTLRSSRELGTRNLVAGLAAAQDRPRVLVSASAVGYYGDRADAELTEESPPGDNFFAETCQAWEHEALEARNLGVRVVHLRAAPVVGENSPFLRPMLPIFRLGVGGRMGSGRQWWPWVHVDDVVRAVEFILDRKIEGPVNLVAPEVVTQYDFAKALGRVLPRPAMVPIPAFALNLALGGLAVELLASRKAVPGKLLDSGYKFKFPDLESALRDATGT